VAERIIAAGRLWRMPRPAAPDVASDVKHRCAPTPLHDDGAQCRLAVAVSSLGVMLRHRLQLALALLAPIVAATALLVIIPVSVRAGTPGARSPGLAEIEERPVPGPVEPGFRGQAYPVPAHPEAGKNQNAVRVTLRNEDGEVVGSDVVRAGQPQLVEALEGQFDHQVAIPWGDGVTAFAPRDSFWAMPSFVELKDMTVRIDGHATSLGDSGIVYHSGSVPLFDDPDTPVHDGIPPRTRLFLACDDANVARHAPPGMENLDSWSIGQQTLTVDLIELGLHRNDRSLIDKGVIGVDWGVAVPINDAAVHELHRECDGRTVPDYGRTHHSTQWLESLSRAVYLLAASEYAGEFRPKIDAYLGRIETIAERLVSQGNWEEWVDNIDQEGHDFTHRTFMMAAALGLSSTLTDDPDDSAKWATMARKIAQRGIGNQHKNGINPERGGYDVKYQMYGVWLAEIYYSTLSRGSGVKAQLQTSISRAVEWMTARVDAETGQIIIGDSTRTCADMGWWAGKPAQSHNAAETIRAFLLWGHVRRDDDLVDQAILLDRGQKQLGNECPSEEAGPSDSTAASPEVTGGRGDRSFETPIGNLSNRRVLAAAVAGVVCFLVLRLLPLARGTNGFKMALRVGSPIAVFLVAVLVLAG
jgi:hypothetical protein